MGLKKRAKVTAKFNLSSLTDIIFLLLIFFMLTSSVVAPNALNLRLPGRKSAPSVITEKPLQVVIFQDGGYFVDGRRVSIVVLDQALTKWARGKKEKDRTIVIAPDPKVPHEYVAAVMDIALKLNINAILASEPAK